MFRSFFSVGGLTALSRLTGFAREVMIGALMGAGPLADAYFVALRLPNQFRAIFGEGAFNSAYVPTYSRVLVTHGDASATLFASRILTLLVISQLALLGFAYAHTPFMVQLIAPGFDADPQKFDMAVGMTRITFPYLAFITIATLNTGTLNAHGFFAVGAFAPVLLNLFIMAFLAIAFLFPNPGIAASWGVLVSGLAQLLLLIAEARRRGVLERLAFPWLDPYVLTILPRARTRRDRLGRPADRDPRRHDPRLGNADGSGGLDQLRGSTLPTASGRHRRRGGNRAAAGDDAASGGE